MTGQDASQWYIARDGKQTGPISEAEINAIAQHGYFRSNDLVWRPGFAEWRPALSVFKPSDAAPVRTQPAAPAVASAPQPAQHTAARSAPAAHPIQSPANSVPAPRDPRSAPQQTGDRTSQPGHRDAAPGYDAPAAAHAPAAYQQVQSGPAPSGYGQTGQGHTGGHTGPGQLGPAPFSGRPAQSEGAKLPVAPPYRGDGTYRPGPQTSATPQMSGLQTGGLQGANLQASSPQTGGLLPIEAERPTTQRPTLPRPEPREKTQPPRRAAVTPIDSGRETESDKPKGRHRGKVAALLFVLAAGGAGIWAMAYPGVLQGLPSLKAIAMKVAPIGGKSADLDARWQQTAHWPVIKREFPDWYGERLREATQLASENKPEDEINKTLVDSMIALRRQNANLALAASPAKLRALASAFLENLRQLKSQSTTQCFNFISQGEGTPGVIDQFQVTDGSKSMMQLQVAAIFDAIGEGRKTPTAHEKPIKSDYDTLMEQLAKLGWSQTDVATFADPKALARAEPARVCQMVQDWFVAHISITDEGTQERLLGETLRPVVSG